MELFIGLLVGFLAMVGASYLGTNMALHNFFDGRQEDRPERIDE